jgi:isopenicillin N synthase-like dioxygenase
MAQGKVPVIDVSGFMEAEPFMKSAEDLKQYPKAQMVVEEMKHAAEKIGFFIVVGTGVDMKMVERAWSAVRDFFDLPLEEKKKIEIRPDWPYGYSFVGQEVLSKSKDDTATVEAPGDLKESWQICLNPKTSPVIPDQPAHFKECVTEYYMAMDKLHAKVCKIMALALGLPLDFFEDKLTSNMNAMRALNYPAQDTPPKPGQLRASAHSDWGTVTLLRQDNAPGGLQVQNMDGTWQDVDTRELPEAWICNIGDLFQFWTGGRIKSTIHRVINPPSNLAMQARRQSIAFFGNLNDDALVAPLFPTENFEPITAGEYLMKKHHMANY